MKKSNIYALAQIAVIESKTIPTIDKLEILHELMEREDLEAFIEEEKEKEKEIDEVF